MERFLSYDRLISLYRKRYDAPEFPEDKLKMAFLDEKYEQFCLHLVKKNLDLNMVKKVIKEIYNQLQNAEEVYKYAMDNSPLFNTIFHYMQHFKTEPEDEYKKWYDETRVSASMYFNDIINNYMNIPNFSEPIKYDKETYYYPKKITNPNKSKFFKLPDVRCLPQDKIQFQYDAEEKYRNDSIEQVKEKRKKIIEEEKDKEEDDKKNEEKKEVKIQYELEEKMKKIKEEEIKALEKIKKAEAKY